MADDSADSRALLPRKTKFEVRMYVYIAIQLVAAGYNSIRHMLGGEPVYAWVHGAVFGALILLLRLHMRLIALRRAAAARHLSWLISREGLIDVELMSDGKHTELRHPYRP